MGTAEPPPALTKVLARFIKGENGSVAASAVGVSRKGEKTNLGGPLGQAICNPPKWYSV